MDGREDQAVAPMRDPAPPAVPRPLYTTPLGTMYVADAMDLLRGQPDGSVRLVFTSPPFPLVTRKAYGNAPAGEYLDWFLPHAREIRRVLAPDGSLVLDLGDAWIEGTPTRAALPQRLLVALLDGCGYHLCQEAASHNTAAMPAPAEWVNVRRCRLKSALEQVYWLSPSPFPEADNRRVLRPYSADMRRMIARGTETRRRPSGHLQKAAIAKDRGGSIPDAVVACGNTDSRSRYITRCRAAGHGLHPARMPRPLAELWIGLCSQPGDLVVDPFAGSNITGAVAEALGRRWICGDRDPGYAGDSRFRFEPEPVLIGDAARDGTGADPA
jgi:site-specific DNA-methyltransferase (cytosine-N4-specific)